MYVNTVRIVDVMNVSCTSPMISIRLCDEIITMAIRAYFLSEHSSHHSYKLLVHYKTTGEKSYGPVDFNSAQGAIQEWKDYYDC